MLPSLLFPCNSQSPTQNKPNDVKEKFENGPRTSCVFRKRLKLIRKFTDLNILRNFEIQNLCFWTVRNCTVVYKRRATVGCLLNVLPLWSFSWNEMQWFHFQLPFIWWSFLLINAGQKLGSYSAFSKSLSFFSYSFSFGFVFFNLHTYLRKRGRITRYHIFIFSFTFLSFLYLFCMYHREGNAGRSCKDTTLHSLAYIDLLQLTF